MFVSKDDGLDVIYNSNIVFIWLVIEFIKVMFIGLKMFHEYVLVSYDSKSSFNVVL